MHHMRREVIAGGRAADAHRLRHLDPPLVLIEFRQRVHRPGGHTLELHEGVAVVDAARCHLRPEPVKLGGAGVFGLAVGLLADEDG